MSDSLRIIHINAEAGFSGGEVQLFLLMEGLRKRGHENLLICQPDSACFLYAQEKGLTTHAIPMRNDLDLPAVLRLRSLFQKHQAQILHLHTGRATWLGGLASQGVGTPVISTRRMDRIVKRTLKTHLLYSRLVNQVVAISDAVAKRLLDGDVSSSMITIINSVIDPESIRPQITRSETRRRLGAQPEDIVFLTLAALIQRKGLDVLLEATSKIDDNSRLRIWIAGKGPEEKKLRMQSQSLGIEKNLTFLGSRNDRGDLLNACDAFVLPSRLEGLGVAALEAMAAGKAVLATRVGGLSEVVIHNETGLLVQADNSEHLGKAMHRLAIDSDLRETLGRNGQLHVQNNYPVSNMIDAYELLYKTVVPRTE